MKLPQLTMSPSNKDILDQEGELSLLLLLRKLLLPSPSRHQRRTRKRLLKRSKKLQPKSRSKRPPKKRKKKQLLKKRNKRLLLKKRNKRLLLKNRRKKQPLKNR